MPDAVFLDLADARDLSAWHDLIDVAPDATAFHRPEFVDVYAGWCTLQAAGVWDEEGERLTCGTWLFTRRGNRSSIPPLCTYAAPISRTPPREADVHYRRTPLDTLLAFVQRHLHAVAFHLPPGTADARPYAWAGFDTRVLYTYVLSIDEPEVMRKQMSRARRRSLREVDPAPASGPSVARAVAASLARQAHRLPTRLEVLTGWATRWAEAFDAQEAEGHALVTAQHRNTSYDLLSGSLDDADPSGRTSLLWSMMDDLRARKVTSYDLCGANTPLIAEFKRSTGAQLTPYVRATWHRPGLARMVARVRPLV